MNAFSKLTVALGDFYQVAPVPPDSDNVPANVRETITKLASAVSWVMIILAFAAAVFFLGMAAARPKQRSGYVVSALVAFGIGTLMATPAAQTYVQDTLEFFI